MFEKKVKEAVQEGKFGDDLDFASAEAYNAIRTNVILSMHSKETAKIIGVTSSVPQEGKSYTSINLAYSLAKNGSRVLLISADMRKPSVEDKVKVVRGKGLSNLLCGEIPMDKKLPILRGILHPNLSLLMAGDIPPNPSELLGSEEMVYLMNRLSKYYHYIILDLPPVGVVIDPIAVSKVLDGIILVVTKGFSQKKSVKKTVAQLKYANVRILGFVFNRHSFSTKKSGKGGYYKTYGSGYYGSEETQTQTQTEKE